MPGGRTGAATDHPCVVGSHPDGSGDGACAIQGRAPRETPAADEIRKIPLYYHVAARYRYLSLYLEKWGQYTYV